MASTNRFILFPLTLYYLEGPYSSSSIWIHCLPSAKRVGLVAACAWTRGMVKSSDPDRRFQLLSLKREREKRPKSKIEFGGERRRRRRKESIKVHPEQFHTEDGSQ